MAKPLPKPMPAIDYFKVGDLQEQHCPRCGVFHGDFFKGRLDIKDGRAFCHACGKFRGSVKKVAPRRRRMAARPAIVPVVVAATSSQRPREHRAAPRGRDGGERDDGSGDSDGDGGGGEPPGAAPARDLPPSRNGRRA